MNRVFEPDCALQILFRNLFSRGQIYRISVGSLVNEKNPSGEKAGAIQFLREETGTSSALVGYCWTYDICAQVSSRRDSKAIYTWFVNESVSKEFSLEDLAANCRQYAELVTELPCMSRIRFCVIEDERL